MRIASLALACGALLALAASPLSAADNVAPDFTLKNLQNQEVKLSDVYKDGPVLLTFWSTWCKNCPDEMKHFQRMFDAHKDKGLTVLAVSIDCSKTVSKVRPWINGRRFNYPVLLDTDHQVKRLYHVNPVPHSFVIDTQGHIVYSHVGYRPGDEKAYEAQIGKLLEAGLKQKADASSSS